MSSADDLLGRITVDPERRSGQPCIRGMRMTVKDVLEYMAGGMSKAEILGDFPELEPDDIRACLAFAAERLLGPRAATPATVYVVQHARPREDADEDVKMIGVYSDVEKAEGAVAHMRAQPGFRDWPHEFSVDPYPLDEDHWTEGFVTIHWNEIPEVEPS